MANRVSLSKVFAITQIDDTLKIQSQLNYQPLIHLISVYRHLNTSIRDRFTCSIMKLFRFANRACFRFTNNSSNRETSETRKSRQRKTPNLQPNRQFGRNYEIRCHKPRNEASRRLRSGSDRRRRGLRRERGVQLMMRRWRPLWVVGVMNER